jgi:hypothetical protein
LPSRLILETDVCEFLAVVIFHDMHAIVSSTDHGGGKRRAEGVDF